MKKVLLVFPRATVYGSGIVGKILPMNLMYLASYLRKNNAEVQLNNFLAEGYVERKPVNGGIRYGLSDNKIKKIIKSYKPDIVGISCVFTAYYDDVVETARLVKEVDKKIEVVIGGAHVSIDPEIAIKPKWIDYAVFGEGEETLLELVKNIPKDKIDGLVYKNTRNKIIKNKPRKLIKNLDLIPFPAWDLIDFNIYGVGGSVFNKNPNEIIYQVVSSRGCPGHCLYCSIHSVWNHSWRGRSPANVVDEIEWLVKTRGAKEFSFQDDSVSVDKKRMNGICKEIIKRNLKISWTTPNGIAHWTLDKEMLRLMMMAGCYRITFGIESGDPETRRWVGKPYSLEQAKELIKYANSIGMWTLATNIIGFPYETKEQVDRTLKYAIESDVDMAFFYVLGPRLGTEIYKIFEKEKLLMKDRKLLFSEDVACDTKYFSGEEIIRMQKRMYSEFYKKRWLTIGAVRRVLGKIRKGSDLVYIMRIGWYGMKLIKNMMLNNKVVSSKTLRV